MNSKNNSIIKTTVLSIMSFKCRKLPLIVIVFIGLQKDFTESSKNDPAPYFIKTKYFWSFDGPTKLEESSDAHHIQGVLDNGIRLSDHSKISPSWLDLGPLSHSCISRPFECKEGFTVLFWMKLDGNQKEKVLFNIAEQEFSRGVRLRIDLGMLRFSTTGLEHDEIFPRTVQRFLEAKWDYTTWTHIGLVWNARTKEMKMFYNCSEAEYTSAGIWFDRSAHVISVAQRFIVGANNNLSHNSEIDIDELGIWDTELMKETICYVFNSRRVHGKYSEWSKFTRCSRTCGKGFKNRTRTCTNPSPRNGGKNCNSQGSSTETSPCLDIECPVDGGYTQWSPFSECSKTCSGGRSIRTRTCTQPPPQYGGRDCSRLGGGREIRVCNLNQCPVHGGYTPWSNFTTCTKSCGNGTMSRNRSCTNPIPRHGGHNCSTIGLSFEVIACNEFPCPVHGGYTVWSAYSECTVTCGGGERKRVRNCTTPAPLYGGRDCDHLGPGEESLPCNTHPCPVHGSYTAWGSFTPCTKSCENGTKWRARHCANPKPEFGGRNCSELGPNFEMTSCNIHMCPIHGNYSEWSEFSTCSTTCNNGTKVRTRTCNEPSPKYSGRNCSHLGSAEEVVLCNENECPVDGRYGPWSMFSECSVSCGADGFQTRTRLCDSPAPRFGGRNCSTLGPSRQIRVCNVRPCPIDGAWGAWSSYSWCSKTCETGSHFRTRDCNDPLPQHGGRNCSSISREPPVQRTECNTQLCPDVVFTITLNLTREEWTHSLSLEESNERQSLAKKILKNVAMIYHNNFSLRKSKVLHIRQGSVLAVIELRFFNKLYSGVMRIQDELFLNNKLGGLPATGLEIETIDVPSVPPANILAYNTSSKSIMTMWEKVPVSQANGEILSFTVLYSGQHHSTSTYRETTLRPDIFSLELTDLQIFHVYYIRILASNRRGPGIVSIPIAVTTDMEVPNAAPEIHSAYNLSSTSVFIRWSGIPTENIRGILLGFVLDYHLGQTVRLTVNPSTRETVLENLQKFSEYAVSIAAFNKKGYGPTSRTVQIKTDEDVPSKAPGNIHVKNSSSTSLHVSWKGIPRAFIHGILKGYYIFYRTEYSHNWRNVTTRSEANHVELRGLRKYHKYFVQVAGFTRKGIGKLCKQMPAMTDEDVPSAHPSNILAVNTSSTSILVQWDSISSAQTHGILLGYTVFYKRRAFLHSPWKRWHVSPVSKAAELIDLRKFTKYNIKVAAVTSKGVGVRSPSKLAVTAEDVPSHPVQFVRANSTSSTSLAVNWGRIPRGRLHGLLRGYKILYRVLGNKQDVYNIRKAIPFQYRIELRGLLKFTSYAIRVVGYTVGDGIASEEVVATTDQDTPSKPPSKIQVNSRWSSSAIPVSWQSITPSYFVHGVLLGYHVKYKPVKNTLTTIKAHYKWITVSPNTLQYTIKGLLPSTTYAIEVLAFTVKGNGIVNNTILAETCSCPQVFTSNWWKLTPYADEQNGDAIGIFPAVLQKAIEKCCKDCSQEEVPDIDFQGENTTNAMKSGILEVNANIGDQINFHFPIHGTKGQTKYADGHPYISLVQSPGAAFIISSTNEYNESNRVVKIMLSSWQMIVILILSSYFVGLLTWLMERKSTSKYFPTSFLYGPLNGLWWAVITVTGVGYGDKTPNTIPGRLLAIVWILAGQVLITLYVAGATSQLSTHIIGVDIRIYGKTIAVIQNSSEYRLGVKKNARYDSGKAYSNLQEVYEDLVHNKVFGALVDTYTVASEQELFDNAKLTVNKIFDYSLHYGVVLGGHARKLEPCLQHYVMQETEEIYEIVTTRVKPLKNVLTRNVRVEKIRSFFDAGTKVYRDVLITTGALLGFFALMGFAGQHVVFHLLPKFRQHGPNVAGAKAGEEVLRSNEQELRDLFGKCTRAMKKTLAKTKKRHLKQVEAYVRERKKADEAIERALKKEDKRKRREERKQNADKSGEIDSDDYRSDTLSEGSVHEDADKVWKNMEPLEGLFSFV